MARKILMIPGPTEVYPEALAAMAQPILPHYGSEFVSLYLETCEGLKKIFETTGEVVLLVGPGTSAMEASATTIIEEGDKVVNIRNGFFGDRFHEVITAVGGIPVDVTAEPGKIVDPEAIRKRIRREKDIKAIFLVHNETSTGVVNPAPQVGEVAQEHDLICYAFVSSGKSFFTFSVYSIAPSCLREPRVFSTAHPSTTLPLAMR